MKTFDIIFNGCGIKIIDRLKDENKIKAITQFLIKWQIDIFCFSLEITEL